MGTSRRHTLSRTPRRYRHRNPLEQALFPSFYLPSKRHRRRHRRSSLSSLFVLVSTSLVIAVMILLFLPPAGSLLPASHHTDASHANIKSSISPADLAKIKLQVDAATPDKRLDSLFTAYADKGKGWTGGDSAYSLPLPDKSTLWLFSDSFVGPVLAHHSRSITTPILHNMFVLQKGTSLHSVYGGTYTHPTPLVTAPGASQLFFSGDGILDNSGHSISVLYTEFTWTGGLATLGTYLASFSLPGLTLENLHRLDVGPARVEWLSWLLPYKGYTYIYGFGGSSWSKQMYIARVTGTNLASSWSYFTGKGWSTDPQAIQPVLSNMASEYSVTQLGKVFLLVTMHEVKPYDNAIYGYLAPTPAGPFTDPTLLYKVPYSGPLGEKHFGTSTVYPYDAIAHPDLSPPGRVLISYCMDTLSSSALYRNIDIYKPRFVNLDLKVVDTRGQRISAASSRRTTEVPEVTSSRDHATYSSRAISGGTLNVSRGGSRKDPRGAGWVGISPPPTIVFGYAISCANASDCWVLGAGSTLARTSNGGADFHPLSMPAHAPIFFDISCPTSSECFAAGEGPTIMESSDGGKSWTAQISPPPGANMTGSLTSISCPTATNCIAVGSVGQGEGAPVILSTSNGGQSWSSQASPRGIGNLLSVSCATEEECWASGSRSTMIVTTDAGIHWSVQPIPSSVGNIYQVSCPSSTVCFGIGDNSQVIGTDDGGASWHISTVPSRIGELLSISCPSNSDCLVTGAGGSLVLTHDGGIKWSLEHAPPSMNNLFASDCPTVNTCYVLTEGGAVLTSTSALIPTATG